MRRAFDLIHPDRWPRRWAVTALHRGTLAVVVLVATVATVQAGSLFERLFTGREAQRAQTSKSSEDATVATVRLTVEGMVCYG